MEVIDQAVETAEQEIETVEQSVETVEAAVETVKQEAEVIRKEVGPATYKEFNRIGGWHVFRSLDAEPEKRWRINHSKYGEHFFAKQNEILPWTREHTRGLFR
jgi:hypothetical protein